MDIRSPAFERKRPFAGFLVSDDAGLITGSTLTANGGQIMV
jgi:hypothetical protein